MPAKTKRPVAKKAATATPAKRPAPKRPAPKRPAPKRPAPKQARVYPSLQMWLEEPDNVIRLKQILADPVFVAACHYVEAAVGVTPEDLIGAKAALDEVIVRKTAMQVGVKAFTVAIANLPNFRKQDPKDVPQPWEYVQAPIR